MPERRGRRTQRRPRRKVSFSLPLLYGGARKGVSGNSLELPDLRVPPLVALSELLRDESRYLRRGVHGRPRIEKERPGPPRKHVLDGAGHLVPHGPKDVPGSHIERRVQELAVARRRRLADWKPGRDRALFLEAGHHRR